MTMTPEDIEQLKRLKILHDSGVLTAEEFDLQKKLVLNPQGSVTQELQAQDFDPSEPRSSLSIQTQISHSTPRLFKSVRLRVISVCLGLLAVAGGTVLVSNWNSDEFSDIKPGADLSGRVLAGEDLRGRNLSGANLRQTDFSDSILDGVEFGGADLSGADLRNASLIGADLSGATLDGAKFTGADLTGASLGGVELNPALVGIKGVPTTTTTTTTTTTVVTLPEGFTLTAPTTQPPRPPSQQATSPQTTSKPVYLERTEVSVVSKTLPDGPWTCRRTYIYTDGKRTSENFSSPTKCGQ